MKFEIKSRFTGAVQFTADIDCSEGELTSIKIGLAVKWGFKNGADLRGADLRGADLDGAYLRGAHLDGAYLGGAYLRGADLGGAHLDGAYLRGAHLDGAYLGGAYLRGADLGGADLRGADLDGAYLRGAHLGGAYLRGADLGGADLGNQWIIQGGTRSDGYFFMLTNLAGEGVRVKAGCRNFTIAEAEAHWTRTRGGTVLGKETFAIINAMGEIATMRGLSFDLIPEIEKKAA
jgi:hypothetical protein